MKPAVCAIFIVMGAALAAGQDLSPAPRSPGNGASSASMTSDLDRLQTAAAQANLDLAHVRIEKWKADAGSKQQAQANADSLQRNLTSALPGLVDGFRAAPQDLSAGFKLYRNLNALYDVLASFTEAAGAFGPRTDYEALAQQLNVIDSVRHDLADNLEGLTASTQSELNALRAQVRSLQQPAAAEAPKKVIVDDTEPAKKTTHKKKPAKSTGASDSNPSATGATGGQPPSSPAKAQ